MNTLFVPFQCCFKRDRIGKDLCWALSVSLCFIQLERIFVSLASMGKGKGKRTGRVEIRRIENPNRRQITFSKRKAGLLKKAAELFLLCDVDLALIISSPSGKLYHSPAPNIDRALERHQKLCFEGDFAEEIKTMKLVPLELENARKLKTTLETTQTHMIGENLDSLSYKELNRLEQKLEIGARKIRSRKEKLSKEYIPLLRQKLKARHLGGDENDGEGGPTNVTTDVIANNQQPERHDGDSEHEATSETDLDLRLY